tara:strand:+ start:26041 stop:26658 length:618 start_codon:yes stop_codon:yes gene_type:complete
MQQKRELIFKKSNKEIELEKDYQNYNLPGRIVTCSIKIYMMVMGEVTLKRGNRRAMMCKCTYEAYKQNNIKKDPIFLSQKFDIKIKQLCKSQNDFYSKLFHLQKLKDFPKVHFSAFDLLHDIAEHMNYKGDKYNEMEDMIEKLYNNMDLLKRIPPREIVISIVHYYKNKENDPISLQKTEQKAIIAHTKLVLLTNMIDKANNNEL